jgi:hypothetical protein
MIFDQVPVISKESPWNSAGEFSLGLTTQNNIFTDLRCHGPLFQLYVSVSFIRQCGIYFAYTDDPAGSLWSGGLSLPYGFAAEVYCLMRRRLRYATWLR